MLFTFPSRYLFTIGRVGVLRLGGWSPHVQTGFHVPRPTRGSCQALPVRGCHPLRPDFPDGSGSLDMTTGLVRVRSPLLTESRLMSFPPATEMFQFAGFASRGYGFTTRYRQSGGFPHSDIFGSKLAPSSPKLFAGCNVLHRLYTPRHPPNALLTLEPPCTVNNPPAVGPTFKAPRSSSKTPLPGKRKRCPDRRPPNRQTTKTSRPPCKANSTLSAKTPAHRIPLPAKPEPDIKTPTRTDPKRSRYYAYASLTLTSPRHRQRHKAASGHDRP